MRNSDARFSRGFVGRQILRAIGGGLVIAAAGCGGSASTGPQPLVPQGSPTSITIEPRTPSFAPGTSQQFTAIASYGNGASANVTESVAWTSSNPAAMTISNTAGTKGLANRLTDASVEITGALDTVSVTVPVTVWSTVLATSLRMDGDVSGVGTGYAIGHLALDASNVYWAGYDRTAGNSGGSIARVPKAGGAVATLASGLGGVNAFICDGAHVYWTEYDPSSGDGAVKRVPVAGGTVEILATGTPPGSAYDVFFPGGIAVDASYVYWGEYVGAGAIRRVPKAGGTVTDLARGQGFGPTALAIGGSYFYGVSNGDGKAGRLPVAGGTVELLATGLANPADLAVDGQAIYWAELIGSTGRILSLPLAGGATVALASSLDNPRSVSVQGGMVYYAGTVRTNPVPTMGVWRVSSSGSDRELAVDASGTAGGLDPFSVRVDADYVYFVDAKWNTPGLARILRARRE